MLRDADTTTIHADELRPGDVLEYGGQTHRIVDVVRNSGWLWPIACDGTGWAIALSPDLVCVRVRRRRHARVMRPRDREV
jgi:hypothetical protein